MTPFIKRRNRRADEGLQDYSLADIAHLITIEAKNVEAMVDGLDADRTGHVRMELSVCSAVWRRWRAAPAFSSTTADECEASAAAPKRGKDKRSV